MRIMNELNTSLNESTFKLVERTETLITSSGDVIRKKSIPDKLVVVTIGLSGEIKLPNLDLVLKGLLYGYDCSIEIAKRIIIPEKIILAYKSFDFRPLKNLREIIFDPKNSTRELEDGAFGNLLNLEKIVLPPLINQLPDFSFSNCISLKEINIGENIRKIGCACFNNCKSLKKITIDNKIKDLEVGNGCFSGCAPEELILPDNSNIEALAATGISSKNIKDPIMKLAMEAIGL